MERIDWIVYTSPKIPNCPWCDKVKELLTKEGYLYFERNIYNIYKEQIFVPLKPVTVPQVYHKGMLIGGYEATKNWIQGSREDR